MSSYRKIAMRRALLIVSAGLIILFSAAGCKNPILGLGPAADLESPSGSINEYKNGDYVRGRIVLDGVSEDDVQIASVKAVLDKKVLEAELSRGATTGWSIPIDTTQYADGEYTIVLTITDAVGHETEKRLLLYFDNTAPTVMVTSSVGISAGASTNSPVIRGEAYDYLFSRIDHLEAEVVSGNASIVGFQGTNGWSLTLQTTGTGTYAVRVTAWDSAGNSNAWMFHSQDMPANTKIEDVAAGDRTGSLGTLNLVPLRKSSQDVEVDLSLDEPRIVVSNPEEGKTAEQNILGGTSVAVGYIEDDDEVDTASIELSTDGGSSWTGLSGAQLSGGGGFVRWNYDLSSLDNGVYSLQVRAADTGKPAGDASLTSYSEIIPFTIDKSAPSVSVDSPAPGTYLSSGTFTVTGEAEDVGGSIDIVRISVNGGGWSEASIAPAENVSWSHSVSGAAPGAVDIKVEAVDNSGKTSSYNLQVYVDVEAPTVEFLSPAAGLFINGTASLQGVSSDNWSLKQVKLQIGGLAWASAAAEVLPPEEFYSWQRSIVSSNYENTGMAVEVNGSGVPQAGTGIWELKIWAEATDKADNVTLSEHRIYIDNSLDRPGINIASPSDGAVMAGSVMLSGSAWDDKNEAGEDLDHVEFRLWKGSDGAGGTTEFNSRFELDTLLGLEDVYGDDSWYKVSGTNTWQVELNTGGEFYPNGTDHNGTVKIDVRAVDKKDGTADLAGNIESIEVTFDDTVPFFSDLSHSSGDYENGTFNLTGTVNDDDSVVRLRVSYNGGVDWTTIGSNLGSEYPFSHSIDTDSLVGSSGILYLRLEALDTANYKTLAGINLNVDNLDPSGTYTAGVADLSGTALVQGTATDAGIVSGVDRIEVSFRLDGSDVNPLNSKGVRTPITVDSRTELGNDGSSNGDDDGYNESMSISGSTWDWWARFNSLSLDDGVLDVIYTVYDNAGNTFTETVSGGNIKNHAPSITSISTGWDLDHDGTIEAGESKTYNANAVEANSVYGDLNYSFNTAYDGQNGVLVNSIRIRPVDPVGAWTDLGAVASAGTLDTTSNAVFSDGDGDYEIEFKVVDTKNYDSALTLEVSVENSDSKAPTLDFYQLTETDADNVKTSGTGHIEIDGNIYLSGTIPFAGRAEDNQKIQSISISIDGGTAVTIAEWDDADNRLEYTASGLPLESGSGFIDDGGALKHRANWKYEWNSASLPTGTGTWVGFTVTDAAGRTGYQEYSYEVVPYISSVETALSSSLSNSLSRSALGKYPVLIESAQSTYETVTIKGWNIDSSAAATTAVRLSKDPDGLDGSTLQGTALSYAGTGDGDNEITADVDAAGSGWLSVVVDGVASRNNVNSNSKSYNLESSSIHQVLADDRYLSLWDITRLWRTVSLADHAVYPSMVMDGDTPHFAYANNSMGWGQGFYLAGTTNKHIIQNWDLFTFSAIDLNTNGDHAALVDVNVVNGNYGDYNAGNYGGIFTNFWFDVPDHTWGNRDFLDNGLWLENLVDAGGTTTAVLNRYQYPDLMLRGTTASTDVFYSVYDALEGRLIFRHFEVGTDDSIDNTSGGRLNNQGTALYTNVEQQDRNGSWPDYNGDDRFTTAGAAQPGETPSGAQYVSTSATEFHAVGATADGSVAVIAYYDTSGSGKLVFSYNTTPDSAAGWSTPVTIEEFVNAQYIDLKVDGSNHIHLAYYDSFNGDVKYAYIPAYNSPADTDYSDDASDSDIDLYTVDSYLIVGEKLSVDISSAGSPFIAYKGLGNTARVAWLTGSAANGASADEFTGSWEIQTIPELITDTDSNRFSAGVDTAGLPVIGYTDDGLEYVRLLDELTN